MRVVAVGNVSYEVRASETEAPHIWTCAGEHGVDDAVEQADV